MNLIKRLFVKTPKIYRRCNELPIHNFNEVATNEDYNYLKKNIDDKVDELVLQNAWLIILDEFIRISKNSMAISTLKKKTGLLLLDKKLQVLEAIKINIHYRNDELVGKVCKSYRVNPTKIDAHIGLVKNDIAKIKVAFQNEHRENEKNETEFDRSIAICLKHGYHINRFKTVVSEWCQILNLIEKTTKAKPE